MLICFTGNANFSYSERLFLGEDEVKNELDEIKEVVCYFIYQIIFNKGH